MSQPIRLVTIPAERYSDYRFDAIFNAYKWDPQVEDHNTVSRHVAVMEPRTAEQLEAWAEKLSEETMCMEEALARESSPAKELGLPGGIRKALPRLSEYDRGRHVRLMRFDFHPTTTGWALSEVNSDVPGGLAEASVLPEIACSYVDGCAPRRNVGDRLYEAFRARVSEGGRIAFVHATSYADDRQVMQFLSDRFTAGGYRTVFAGPDHIRWYGGGASCIVEGEEGRVDGVVRFFPLEWLTNLPSRTGWTGYYGADVPSCNHPAAMLTQSKRLPLIWDRLGVDVTAWKELLPETVDPRRIRDQDGDWIYKPALGRVGEGISIREAVPEKELKQIGRLVRRYPGEWVAQRKFESLPLETAEGEAFHMCVGAFTVNGKRAGFYSRISPYPRIDARAKDIPLLVAKEG